MHIERPIIYKAKEIKMKWELVYYTLVYRIFKNSSRPPSTFF